MSARRAIPGPALWYSVRRRLPSLSAAAAAVGFLVEVSLAGVAAATVINANLEDGRRNNHQRLSPPEPRAGTTRLQYYGPIDDMQDLEVGNRWHECK